MNTSMQIEKKFIECAKIMDDFIIKFAELQTLVHQYKNEHK